MPSSYPVPSCAVPVSAGMMVAVPLELAGVAAEERQGPGRRGPVRAGHRGHGKDPHGRRGRVLQGGRGRGSAGEAGRAGPGEGQPGASRDAGAAGGQGRAGRHRRDRGAGAAGRPVREGGTGKASGQGLHDPGDRGDDADAGRAARGRDRRAGRGPGPGPVARPWRPASARAAGDWRNALGPVPLEELRDLVLGSGLARAPGAGLPRCGDDREEEAAAGGVAGRDAAAGAGHAREQGVLRHRGHGR